MWVPVGIPTNRDWISIGDTNYVPGVSHVQFFGHYPGWGDSTVDTRFNKLLVLKSNCQWV